MAILYNWCIALNIMETQKMELFKWVVRSSLNNMKLGQEYKPKARQRLLIERAILILTYKAFKSRWVLPKGVITQLLELEFAQWSTRFGFNEVRLDLESSEHKYTSVWYDSKLDIIHYIIYFIHFYSYLHKIKNN